MARRGFHFYLAPPPRLNLVDWVALAVAISILAFVIYPVFAKRNKRPNRYSCHSNVKQISLSLLAYAQDHDERLPVAASSARVGGLTARRNWAVEVPVPGRGMSPGLLTPYAPRGLTYSVFQDSEIETPAAPLAYMYNDLAAGSRLDDFVALDQTVVVVDGEELLDNVGHAWEPRRNAGENGAVYNAQGRCDAGRGAFVTHADTTRHAGGAIYAFADGHVKWFLPGLIWFPPRASASLSHKDAASGALLGPEPGGRMAWDNRTWAGTFHLQ